MAQAMILDIDGTLIDTNYHHALAWYRAFRQHGVVLPIWRIHRAIGMGGDQLVEELAGSEVEAEDGDKIRDAEGPLYMTMIEEIEPFEGAKELLRKLRERERTIVLASSAKDDEVDHYLDLLEAREVVDAWTTSADVEATKPEPDLVEAALEKAQTRDALMIGDTVWDVKAARRAGIETIAVLSGGYGEAELRDAGAREVFESIAELAAAPEALAR
jgi:HAD superfamily hydrolase (TIGR01549 family)